MPDATQQPSHEVAHEVLGVIRQIVRRIAAHSKSLSKVAGLTVPQLMCLKAVGELAGREDEVTASMVGKQVQLSPGTVSRILDRLVRAGLVDRERRSKDRRKVCLSLTARGQERFHALPVPLQERFVARLMDLDPSTRADLLASLRTIAELMDADELEAAPILAADADLHGGPDPT